MGFFVLVASHVAPPFDYLVSRYRDLAKTGFRKGNDSHWKYRKTIISNPEGPSPSTQIVGF